jgi:hypothetical protein
VAPPLPSFLFFPPPPPMMTIFFELNQMLLAMIQNINNSSGL